MKKLTTLLLALAAVACSSDITVEAPKGAAIEFENIFVENATRAVALTKENIQDFGVYGFVESSGKQGQIFNNTRVYRSGEQFCYDIPQYWIGGAQYYFTAIAPYQDAKWSYSATSAAEGTIEFNNLAAAASQDLIFAYIKPEKTPDTIESKPAAVSFNFHHILSRVKFSFKNGFASTANITLKVTDVKISDAHARGTLDLSNGVLATSWNALGSMQADFGDTTVENNAENIMEPGATAQSAHLYLIPVKANYTVHFNITLYQAGIELGHYNRSATLTVDMERGKSYEFKAVLDHTNTSDHGALNTIEFQVGNINGWTNN